jgi:hypothetical protein
VVRGGLVEEAVAAYQAHDQVVAADSKSAATLALLQDWWTAWQQGERDPAAEVIVLAARRDEVDRLNSACQELLATQGRLGAERLQVEDRQLAVGDRVVCGHNAIAELGVANGSRGVITALDPQARTLTIHLDGTDGRTAVLPGSNLDGRRREERNRRVDLAYATTGHRAQGLTRGRPLVRLTGTEDVNWLYVQLSRARQDTRLYAVVGPEPQGAGELDLPDREQPDAYLQLAQALSRAGGQTLAIDTPSSPNPQRLSTAELRAERDRLRLQLDQAPRDRSRELARAAAHREQAEEALAAHHQPTGRPPPGMLRWLCRNAEQPAGMPGGLAVATQQANRAHDRERELRQHQQRRDGWVDPGAAGLAAGRRRDRALPTHLRHLRPGAGPRPGAGRPSAAGRPAASPDGHRTRPGQAARRRPHPPAPASQRTPHPAATSRAAWPARPRAGRWLAPLGWLAPLEGSTRWPVLDPGPSTMMTTGPADRCGRSTRQTCRPSLPTSITRTLTSS